MPSTQPRLRTPPAIQKTVIERRLVGQKKDRIARDLGLGRNTVTRILERSNTDGKLEELRLKCLDVGDDAVAAMHNQIKSGDGDLGRLLLRDLGAIGESAAPRISFHDDAKLQVAIGTLLPPGGAAPSSKPTQAAAKPPDDE